ncbi:MAG: NifU N-terminal domain-containing protein [Acidimicrobiia bacterium]
MPEPTVTVQGTPNPDAAKFTVDRTLVEGGGSNPYFDAASAVDDPLATVLFTIEGVESLLLAEDFVTVTKSPSASWEDLVPEIEKVIKETLGPADP